MNYDDRCPHRTGHFLWWRYRKRHDYRPEWVWKEPHGFSVTWTCAACGVGLETVGHTEGEIRAMGLPVPRHHLEPEYAGQIEPQEVD